MKSFLLTPSIVTLVYILSLAIIHYRREKDLIRTLPHMLEKGTLSSVGAIFSLLILGKLFLIVIG